jgi:hypothetical protein
MQGWAAQTNRKGAFAEKHFNVAIPSVHDDQGFIIVYYARLSTIAVSYPAFFTLKASRNHSHTTKPSSPVDLPEHRQAWIPTVVFVQQVCWA